MPRSPLKEEQVHIVVTLGQEVAEDPVRVATFDLVGREAKIQALDKVPELGHLVLVEPPAI